MCLSQCTHGCIHACVYAHAYVCMCVCIYVWCTYVRIRMCVIVCVRVCVIYSLLSAYQQWIVYWGSGFVCKPGTLHWHIHEHILYRQGKLGRLYIYTHTHTSTHTHTHTHTHTRGIYTCIYIQDTSPAKKRRLLTFTSTGSLDAELGECEPIEGSGVWIQYTFLYMNHIHVLCQKTIHTLSLSLSLYVLC